MIDSIDSPITDIIRRCGGAKVVAREAERVSVDAVYKWTKIGIPDRHWPLVIRLSGVTADELVQANTIVRAGRPVTTRVSA